MSRLTLGQRVIYKMVYGSHHQAAEYPALLVRLYQTPEGNPCADLSVFTELGVLQRGNCTEGTGESQFTVLDLKTLVIQAVDELSPEELKTFLESMESKVSELMGKHYPPAVNDPRGLRVTLSEDDLDAFEAHKQAYMPGNVPKVDPDHPQQPKDDAPSVQDVFPDQPNGRADQAFDQPQHGHVSGENI